MSTKSENQKLKNCLLNIYQAPNSKLFNFQTFQDFNSNISLIPAYIDSKKRRYIKRSNKKAFFIVGLQMFRAYSFPLNLVSFFYNHVFL